MSKGIRLLVACGLSTVIVAICLVVWRSDASLEAGRVTMTDSGRKVLVDERLPVEEGLPVERPGTPPPPRPVRADAPSPPPPKGQEPRDHAAEYEASRAEFVKQADEYRSSIPVYAEFGKVLVDFLVPTMIEGELARRQIMKEQERDLAEFEKNFHYDQKVADKAILETIAAVFGPLFKEANLLVKEGLVQLTDEEFKGFNDALGRVETHARASRSLDAPGPYPVGSFAHLEYLRNFSYASMQFIYALTLVVCRLPPDLEQTREDLVRRRQEITGQESNSYSQFVPMVPVDPYLELLHKIPEKGDKITELYNEIEQIRDHLSPK